MTESEAGSAAALIANHYDELRALAHSFLRRERVGHTLETTGLVNEAYLRLAGQRGLTESERGRFFAIASTTMRRVLVDHARGRSRLKRGGGVDPITFDDGELALTDREADELVVLDEAISRLEAVNPRGSQVVQYRFFGGLTLEETAALLGVSAKTVQRDWLVARAWLRKEVARELGLLAD
ncbi:MAG: ECF-type sigma factor [Gemmatimonadota bacterium]